MAFPSFATARSALPLLGALFVVVALTLPGASGLLAFTSSHANAPAPSISPIPSGLPAGGVPRLTAIEPLHPPRSPAALAPGANVNPTAYYSSEPAPMGITDFGIGPSGRAYTYQTSEFDGTLNINKLTTYSSGASSSSLTVQLNIVLTFHRGGASYAYWIQDVAFLDTSSKYLWYENNIWNFSSSGAGISSSTVAGNGTIYSGQVYIAGASSSLAGNDVTVSYPTQIGLLCVASVVKNKPVVAFEYRYGSRWVTYDNAVFSFAKGATSVNFTVDGTGYNGYGLFNDAELILGGPGGGSSTAASAANLSMSLAYFNGVNFQAVPNAYNFGSDTAETISGVSTSRGVTPSNGSLSDVVGYGSSKLAQLYNSSFDASVLIFSQAPSGSLALNGTTSIAFAGSPINVTIAPGTYDFSLSVLGTVVGSRVATVAAGSNSVLYIYNGTIYTVTFVEAGLPTGQAWSIAFGPGTVRSYGSSLNFSAVNGTYPWHSFGTPGYLGNPASGSVTVAGINQTVHIAYGTFSFGVAFLESGLPGGTTWSVTIGGTLLSSSTPTVLALELNGSFNYSIGNVAGYNPSKISGTVVVHGGNESVAIAFTRFPTQVNKEFTKSVGVVSLASIGSSSLVAVRLSNGSYRLVFFTATTNHSRILGTLGGGASVSTDGVGVAGGSYFVDLWNAGATVQSFEKVSTAGTQTAASLPLGRTIPWLFVPGNTTNLYATSQGYLVEVSPSAYTIVANYSSLIPANLWIHAVLRNGPILFVAGSVENPNGTTTAYLGAINTQMLTLGNISRLVAHGAGVSSMFDSLAMSGGYLYVGGGLTRSNTSAGTASTFEGLLYRYNSLTRVYQNRSSLLPAGGELVSALESWRSGLLLTMSGSSLSGGSSSAVGGLLLLAASGAFITNDTAALPTGFVPYPEGVTSETSGHVFLGGVNAVAGVAQITALSR